jgi:hypothetical protein
VQDAPDARPLAGWGEDPPITVAGAAPEFGPSYRQASFVVNCAFPQSGIFVNAQRRHGDIFRQNLMDYPDNSTNTT